MTLAPSTARCAQYRADAEFILSRPPTLPPRPLTYLLSLYRFFCALLRFAFISTLPCDALIITPMRISRSRIRYPRPRRPVRQDVTAMPKVFSAHDIDARRGVHRERTWPCRHHAQFLARAKRRRRTPRPPMMLLMPGASAFAAMPARRPAVAVRQLTGKMRHACAYAHAMPRQRMPALRCAASIEGRREMMMIARREGACLRRPAFRQAAFSSARRKGATASLLLMLTLPTAARFSAQPISESSRLRRPLMRWPE